MGLTTQPDPQPQRNRFIRSDQYSFIREGVPALALKVSAEPNTPEAKVEADWTRDRYHAPSDDLDAADRSAGGGRLHRLIGRLALRIANRPSRPAWKADSFFKRFEKTPGAGRVGLGSTAVGRRATLDSFMMSATDYSPTK